MKTIKDMRSGARRAGRPGPAPARRAARALCGGGLLLASVAAGCGAAPEPRDAVAAAGTTALLSQAAVELTSGVPVSGVAGRSFLSPYGVNILTPSRLMFDLTGGTDPQIFLARGRIPSLTNYDIRVGFGFPSLNLQTEVEPGEWYLGVRDVNLDLPLPAETFTLTATVQDRSAAPPQSFGLSGTRGRETSNVAGQLQYFTVDAPEGWGVVDVATTERFGSGDLTLFGAFDGYPRVVNGGVSDYTWASDGSAGLHKRFRAITPRAGKVVVAVFGGGAGYENAILQQQAVPITLTSLQNNKDVKVSGTEPQHFFIEVPAGQTRLTFSTSGGKGASRLSASLAGPILATTIFPEVSAEHVASDVPGKPNDATLVLNNPQPGEYFLRLDPDGAAGYTDVSVRARYTSPED